jgi:hypothetical protein
VLAASTAPQGLSPNHQDARQRFFGIRDATTQQRGVFQGHSELSEPGDERELRTLHRRSYDRRLSFSLCSGCFKDVDLTGPFGRLRDPLRRVLAPPCFRSFHGGVIRIPWDSHYRRETSRIKYP